MASARFDDLRPHRRRSFALSPPERLLEARRLEDVRPVLMAAEAAVNAGKWVAGFVAYEAAPAFDPALEVVDPRSKLGAPPLAWFMVSDRRGPAETLRPGRYELGEWTARCTEDEHLRAIEKIQTLIKAGETYQVNFTFRMQAPFTGSAAGLYNDLVNSQTCGYGALIDGGRWVVASASPELFFEWRHGRIISKPMKGTIRRGLTTTDDEEQRRMLRSSTKDQAENLMIVDMVRNDLGRVARVGSVKVPSLFTTEKYDTVWQLTSIVEAETRPGIALDDVFGAIFPCASITGAPKVATMGIIRDLETDPRGVYCGAVGFGGPGPGGDSEWAFNVAIRTVVVDRTAGVAHYGTGGGVTYDSTASGEYEEALLKAAVLDRRSASFDLIETIKWTSSEGFWLLDRHLARLIDSARFFDIPLDPAEVRAALRTAVADRAGSLRVRLSLGRTGRLVVTTDELVPTGTIKASVDVIPIDPDDVFLYHKTSNRRTYDQARARAGDVDDVILVNPVGRVTETTIANLAVEIDGMWWTPPLSDGLLPGTYRAELLAAGRLHERSITVPEIKAASRIARINAVRGWEPLELV